LSRPQKEPERILYEVASLARGGTPHLNSTHPRMANSLHAVLSPTVVLVHWNFAAQMAIHFYEYLPLFLQIWSASRLMRLFGASFRVHQPSLGR